MALACGLAAQGVDVRLVDRAAGPAETSRANILHAHGVEVLDRLGALGDLRERSLEPAGIRMHVGGRPIATMRFLPDERERTQALFVSQAAIEAELRRRLDELGVPVHWGTEVTALDPDAWVVGCDGARSRVRELAGIDFPGVPVAERFLLADVRADWARDRSLSAGWYHRDGMLLAMPMPGGLWRLMAVVPSDASLPTHVVDRLRRLLVERAGQPDIGIRETVWASVFRIHRRLAADHRRGKVLVAGDAAHLHSPVGGQGMNTGIGDAENLAGKLGLVVRGLAGPELLDTYGAERRPLAADAVRNHGRHAAAAGRDRADPLPPRPGGGAVAGQAVRAAPGHQGGLAAVGLVPEGPTGRPGPRRPVSGRRVPACRRHTDAVACGTGPGLGTDRRLAGAVVRGPSCAGGGGPPAGRRRRAPRPPDAHLVWRGSDAVALRERLAAMLRPASVGTMRR